ncbi:MAG: mechanosensitive ion channel family protein [Candidatus Hodarchaeales archaeon]|jgi:small-conductance mechanosensitive channel
MTYAQNIITVDLFIRLFIVILGITVIFITQRVFQHIIERSVKKARKVSLDVINGLKVIVRVIAATAILYVIMIAFELSLEEIIGVSAFLGAIVSFGSAQAIQNFIAGVYVLVTRPFGVGDLISTGTAEGFVTEISLNFTRLRTINDNYHYIPNKKILSTNIINYNRKKAYEITDESPIYNIKELSRLLSAEEIIRYSFEWGAPLGNLKKAKEKIKHVCDKYEPLFGYLPEFFLYSISHRMIFKFIITTDDDSGEKIIKHLTDFRDEIALNFH